MTTHTSSRVSIVGFGRFGQVLQRLLQNDFQLTVFQRHAIDPKLLGPNTVVAPTLSQVYSNNTVFFATPIETFAEVIRSHQPYFRPGQLLMDTLSVKTHPSQVLKKALKGTKTRALLTHPMFGPDSSRNGFAGLSIVLDQFLATHKDFIFWQHFFNSKGLHVINMTPEQHDNITANSLALTHLLARTLDRFDIQPSTIDTPTFRMLLELRTSLCHDTPQLFHSLQTFNPAAKEMHVRLQRCMSDIITELDKKEV